MKYLLMSIIFTLFVTLPLNSEQSLSYSRLYFFRIIAFNIIYDVYCTAERNGYYRYPYTLNGNTLFVTYETDTFLKQSGWDENFTILNESIPLNIWSSSRGWTYRMVRLIADPSILIKN